MNIIYKLQEALQHAFKHLFHQIVPLEDLVLQPTRKEFTGSHTFVTFPWAKACQQPPKEIARQLGSWLKQHIPWIADVQVIQGFVNITLTDRTWIQQLAALNQEKYNPTPAANRPTVVVEFSSPNTNKPLHLGHLRNTFLGNALATILQAAGCTVYKVNLVNDRGIHICKSMVAYQHFGQGETPEKVGMKGDHWVGKYYVQFEQAYQAQVAALLQTGVDPEHATRQAPLLQEAQAMLQKWEQGDPAVRALWKQMNDWVYQGFEQTYQQLGITFDKTYYESDTYLLGKQVVEEGRAKGLFYKKETGGIWVDLRAAGLDEKVVLRTDGTAVYLTQDLGTADLRYQDYAFDQHIYVVGDEQNYHFKVLFTLMHQLGRPYASGMYHLAYGMVDLPTGKMKSREGTVVDADNLIATMCTTAEEHTKALGKVGDCSLEEAQACYHQLAMGALTYFLLRVSATKRLLFDPKASIDFQGDTGPFIQYTHARIASILRKAKQAGIVVEEIVLDDLYPLHPTERDVIIQLCQFPHKLQEAAASYSPAVIALYVLELAKAYNRLYTELPILYTTERASKLFRLYLSAWVATGIKKNMQLLGIAVPERM